MKIAIVASRDFPLSGWGFIEERIKRLNPATHVLIRPNQGTVDEIIGIYAQRQGLSVIYVPVTEKGRGGTFKRDISMVDRADKVIAFFHPDRIMDGGTGHIVEKAQDAHKPVEAWTLVLPTDEEEPTLLVLVGSGGYDNVSS